MAQTKRKRRTKHRGNAAGAVEVRGRTSKPNPNAPRPKAAGRGGRAPGRELKPPTLQGSAIKAFFGAVILFVFFAFLTKDTTTSQAITMCIVAFVLYTPIMYVTDKWIYGRKLKQQERARTAPRR